MRIRDIFHIPDGEKVTDKAFTRVLISSICGILLCMGCLAGTTWAWFVAGTENTDNVIAIATVTADVTVYSNDSEVIATVDNTYLLSDGTYHATIQVTNTATNSQRPTYVLITVTQDQVDTLYYLSFDYGQNEADMAINVTGSPAVVHFSPQWAQPVALLLNNDTLIIGEAATDSE